MPGLQTPDQGQPITSMDQLRAQLPASYNQATDYEVLQAVAQHTGVPFAQLAAQTATPMPNQGGFLTSLKNSGYGLEAGLGVAASDLGLGSGLYRHGRQGEQENPVTITQGDTGSAAENFVVNLAEHPGNTLGQLAGQAAGFLIPGTGWARGLEVAGRALTGAKELGALGKAAQFGGETAIFGAPSLAQNRAADIQAGRTTTDDALREYAAAAAAGVVQSQAGMEALLAHGRFLPGMAAEAAPTFKGTAGRMGAIGAVQGGLMVPIDQVGQGQPVGGPGTGDQLATSALEGGLGGLLFGAAAHPFMRRAPVEGAPAPAPEAAPAPTQPAVDPMQAMLAERMQAYTQNNPPTPFADFRQQRLQEYKDSLPGKDQMQPMVDKFVQDNAGNWNTPEEAEAAMREYRKSLTPPKPTDGQIAMQYQQYMAEYNQRMNDIALQTLQGAGLDQATGKSAEESAQAFVGTQPLRTQPRLDLTTPEGRQAMIDRLSGNAPRADFIPPEEYAAAAGQQAQAAPAGDALAVARRTFEAAGGTPRAFLNFRNRYGLGADSSSADVAQAIRARAQTTNGPTDVWEQMHQAVTGSTIQAYMAQMEMADAAMQQSPSEGALNEQSQTQGQGTGPGTGTQRVAGAAPQGGREVNAQGDAANAQQANAAPQRTGSLTDEQRQQIVADLLSHLTDKQREVLTQYNYEGRSFADIGAESNRSAQAVQQVHARAKEALLRFGAEHGLTMETLDRLFPNENNRLAGGADVRTYSAGEVAQAGTGMHVPGGADEGHTDDVVREHTDEHLASGGIDHDDSGDTYSDEELDHLADRLGDRSGVSDEEMSDLMAEPADDIKALREQAKGLLDYNDPVVKDAVDEWGSIRDPDDPTWNELPPELQLQWIRAFRAWDRQEIPDRAYYKAHADISQAAHTKEHAYNGEATGSEQAVERTAEAAGTEEPAVSAARAREPGDEREPGGQPAHPAQAEAAPGAPADRAGQGADAGNGTRATAAKSGRKSRRSVEQSEPVPGDGAAEGQQAAEGRRGSEQPRPNGHAADADGAASAADVAVARTEAGDRAPTAAPGRGAPSGTDNARGAEAGRNGAEPGAGRRPGSDEGPGESSGHPWSAAAWRDAWNGSVSGSPLPDADKLSEEEQHYIESAPTEKTQQRRVLEVMQQQLQARGIDVMLSSDGAPAPRTSRAALESLRDRFLSPGKWDKLVTVYDTLEQARAAGHDYFSAALDGRVGGFVAKGHVGLIANGIPKGAELAVFLHEAGVHLGMRKLLGAEKYNDIIDQVKQWADADEDSLESRIAKAAERRVRRAEATLGKPYDTALEREEHLAYFVEEAVKAGVDPTAVRPSTPLGRFLGTIWGAFKSALRKLGMNPEGLDAQDVVDLAAGAAGLKLHGAEAFNGLDRNATWASVSADHPIRDLALPDKVRAALNPRDPDSFIVKTLDTLHENVVRRAKDVTKGFMTIRDLTKAYGHIDGMTDFASRVKEMGASMHRLALEYSKAVEPILTLPKETRRALLEVMRDATITTAHPDLPFDDKANAHLGRNSAEWAQVHLKWNKLGQMPDGQHAQALYRQTRDMFQSAYDRKRALIEAKAKALGVDMPKLPESPGPYFPLVRNGNWIVTWKSPELRAAEESANHQRVTQLKGQSDHYLVSFERTERGANRLADQLSAQGKAGAYVRRRADYMREVSNVSRVFLDKIDQVLEANGVNNDTRRDVRDMYIRALPDLSVMKRELSRMNVAGVKPDDMMYGLSHTAMGNAFYISRLEKQDDVLSALSRVREADDKGTLYNMLQKWYGMSSRHQEHPLINTLQNYTFLQMIGSSPAFLTMQATQPWLTTFPELAGRRGVGAARAATELMSATKDAWRVLRATQNEQGFLHYVLDFKQPGKFGLTENEGAVLQRLLDTQVLDMGLTNDIAHLARGTSSFAAKAMRLSSALPQMVEVMSRVASGLASYRLDLKSGMDHDAAMQRAETAVADTLGDYSSTNTPYLMQSEHLGGLNRLLMQFHKYQQ